MNEGARSKLLKIIPLSGAASAFSPLMRGRAIIYMLHRFQVPELGIAGHDPVVIRQSLEHLRKRKFEFISLSDLILRLTHGELRNRVVVFTVDDGYFEHSAIAAPLFAEFDCPVTTFLTTGFTDGSLWFWWDQIEYVLRHTKKTRLEVRTAESPLTLEWRNERERRNRQVEFKARCKTLPDRTKQEAIDNLARAAEVSIPSSAPQEYQPMSWSEARACERLGMTFGAHTVTHPILSKTTDEQSAEEITESWTRLKSLVAQPAPIFCYPNGLADDFGKREIRTVQNLGLIGAVAANRGFVDRSLASRDEAAVYRLPRLGFPATLQQVAQDTSGFERFRQMLRS